jgi:outer membrane protein OmpA-like peptidoglycan-associated protein
VVSPAALPPQIVAEAPPAPPPAITRFVVFFDFDRSNLTAEASDVVAVAVRTAQQTGMVRVVVTGHTDTVGSQRYNQMLSERRAGAVRTEILRLGMNPSDITATGANFSEPLVPTGPGVREPQNRRAVIDLGYNLTATLIPSSESGE